MDIRLEVKRLYSMIEDHIVLDLVREFGEEFARRKIYFYLKWLIEKASKDGREVTEKDVRALSKKMKSFMKEDKEKEDLKSKGRKYPREKLSTNRAMQFHEFRDIITDIYRVFDRKYNEARLKRIWVQVKNLTPYEFQLVVDALCDTRRHLPIPQDFIPLARKMTSTRGFEDHKSSLEKPFSPKAKCQDCNDLGFRKYHADFNEVLDAMQNIVHKYESDRLFLVCACHCSEGDESLKRYPALPTGGPFDSSELDYSLFRPGALSVDDLIKWWKKLIELSNDHFELKKVQSISHSKTGLEKAQPTI